MITILFVETSPSGVVGGSFFSLLELIRALDKDRYRPLVLFRDNHFLVGDFIAAGAAVFIYGNNLSPSKNGRRNGAKLKSYIWRIIEITKQRRNIEIILAVCRNNPFAAKAIDIIKKYKVDLLHLNDGLTPSIPFLTAIPKGLPTIVHERKIRDYSPLEKPFLQRVDLMICISKAVDYNVQAYFSDFSRKITLPNPLSSRFHQSSGAKNAKISLLKQLGLPEDAFLIVQLSNIISWKGQDILLKAMQILARENDKSVLVFVGGTPPGEGIYEAKLREKATAYGLGSRVRFCGFQEEISAYYHAADVLVHVPSRPEPFGRIVLEAMQLGKPVVTGNFGGTAELVQHGVTGLLVPPEDASALASALLNLINDESLRRKLGTEAAKVAQENYSPQSITRRVEASYKELVRGSENK